jgi:hypothetical protein
MSLYGAVSEIGKERFDTSQVVCWFRRVQESERRDLPTDQRVDCDGARTSS